MKQNRQIIKGNIFLLLFFFAVTIITAQTGFLNKKSTNNVSSENVLLESLKVNPLFTSYFKNAQNPNLADLLKSQVSEPKIDSMVSTAYDTTYQKVKNTFEYDANGFITVLIRKYYDEGAVISGQNYNMEWTSNGRLKSFSSMKNLNGVWINDQKKSYSYDPDGNQISDVTERWDTASSSWVYSRKHEYTYDANHNMLSDVEARWSSGAWVNDEKYEWSYDANNNQTLEVYKRWSSGAWVNSAKHELTYDGNKKTLDVYSRWSSGAWENSSKKTYTYDSNNNLISENEYLWLSPSSTWKNSRWILYTYNASNKITFKNEKKWDNATSSWLDKERTSWTYNLNGKVLHTLNEDYKSGAWVNDREYIYTYDANDNILSYIERYHWNGSDWDENNKYNFRYNSEGNCNGGNHETWFSGHWVSADAPLFMFMPWIFEYSNEEGELTEAQEIKFYSTIIFGYEYSVYYTGVTDVKENNSIKQSFMLEQNYPNPFNPTTKINYSIPNTERVVMKVYDILGNEITTLVNKEQSAGKYSVNFDAGNLTSGIYFYQITSGKFNQVHKMMLLK